VISLTRRLRSRRLEAGEELKERTIDAVREALERMGVIFTNGGEPGVKLGKSNLTRTAGIP
jgi:hypothetical protein